MKLMKSIVNSIFADKKYSEKRKELLEELLRSTMLLCGAAFTIVVACVAWYVSNTKVDSGGVSISHQYEKVTLATKGEREQKEMALMHLGEGSKKSIGPDIYYYTNDGVIALRLESNDVKVSPGKSGEITFYVIPEKDGSQSVNLYLVLAGYSEEKDQLGNLVGGSKIEDNVLNSLLSGHILLFQTKQDNNLNDWIPGKVNENGVVYSIQASNPNAKKDEPWQITVYWEWPLRYENMVNDYNGQLNGLISSTDYEVIGDTGYKYNQVFLTKETNISGNDEKKSDAYNQADEYIGKTADDLYVSIQTDLVE